MLIEPVVANRAVVPFDASILLLVIWLNIVQLNSFFLCPFDHVMSDILKIDTVNPFVIPTRAFHVAQVQEAQAKAPVALPLRQSQQPLRYLIIFITEFRFVAITTFADKEGSTSRSDGDPTLGYGSVG